MLQLLRVSLGILLILFYSTATFAVDIAPSIFISEVYAAPNSEQKEWIELFNPSSQNISLENWKLFDQLSTPSLIHTFNLGDILTANGYMVVELNTNKLNNEQDGVILQNSEGIQVQMVQYSSAILNESKSFLNSQEEIVSGFRSTPTPGVRNKEIISSPIPSKTPEPSATPIFPNQETEAKNTSTAIYIADFLACPEQDSQEWIKIKNTSKENISLKNWYFRDSQSNNISLSEKNIDGDSMLLITLSQPILNNTGDVIYLYLDSMIIDSKQYSSCTTGLSYEQTNNNKQLIIEDNSTLQNPQQDSTEKEKVETEHATTNQITEYKNALQNMFTVFTNKKLVLDSKITTDKKDEKWRNQQEKVLKKETFFSGIIGSIALLISGVLLL